MNPSSHQGKAEEQKRKDCDYCGQKNASVNSSLGHWVLCPKLGEYRKRNPSVSEQKEHKKSKEHRNKDCDCFEESCRSCHCHGGAGAADAKITSCPHCSLSVVSNVSQLSDKLSSKSVKEGWEKEFKKQLFMELLHSKDCSVAHGKGCTCFARFTVDKFMNLISKQIAQTKKEVATEIVKEFENKFPESKHKTTSRRVVVAMPAIHFLLKN